MKEHDEIKQVQQELESLKQQLNLQHRKIVELQQRLNQLTGIPQTSKSWSPAQWSLENFIGLKLIQFIGIIVLVIGLSIGVKYAIDRELISVGMRIILAYAAGLLLYFLSVKLKSKFKDFSAILFGGAMASLYFTTYAAHAKYNLFPFALAFALMVSFTIYTTYEAIRYNRQVIALLGLVGAYGIPFLISKNNDRADLFFLYISLINIGVIFLVIKKSWRAVGLVAHIITWTLFIGWAMVRLNVASRQIGMIFLILFFLIFHFAIFGRKLIQKEAVKITGTYQAVFNYLALYVATLFVFGLSSNSATDISWITISVCFLIALQAIASYKFWKEEALLIQALFYLALTLFILFIASNWDGFTVTLLWLVTAVVMFACGFKLRSVGMRMAAISVMGLTLVKLIAVDSLVFNTVQKVIAYLVLGVLLLVVSFFYQKFRQQLFSEKE